MWCWRRRWPPAIRQTDEDAVLAFQLFFFQHPKFKKKKEAILVPHFQNAFQHISNYILSPITQALYQKCWVHFCWAITQKISTTTEKIKLCVMSLYGTRKEMNGKSLRAMQMFKRIIKRIDNSLWELAIERPTENTAHKHH